MNALEKLGFERNNHYNFIRYSKNVGESIAVIDINGFGLYSTLYPTLASVETFWANETRNRAFTFDELLALAEVIKEMEASK